MLNVPDNDRTDNSDLDDWYVHKRIEKGSAALSVVSYRRSILHYILMESAFPSALLRSQGG